MLTRLLTLKPRLTKPTTIKRTQKSDFKNVVTGDFDTNIKPQSNNHSSTLRTTLHPRYPMTHWHSGISSTTLSLQIRSHRSRILPDSKTDFKINIVVQTNNLSSQIKPNQTQSTPILLRHSRTSSPSLHHFSSSTQVPPRKNRNNKQPTINKSSTKLRLV